MTEGTPIDKYEVEESNEDRVYGKTQILLFLLLEHISAFRLLAIVSAAKHLSWDAYLREANIAQLDGFVRHLSLELVAPLSSGQENIPEPG